MSLKNNIKQIISRLTVKEQSIVLKSLINENIQYTKNNNGYFFNLSQFEKNDPRLLIIYNSLLSIEENRTIIKKIDDTREKSINEYKKVLEDNLKLTLNKKIIEYKNIITKIPEKNYTNIYLDYKKITKEYIIHKEKPTKNTKPSINSIEYKLLMLSKSNKKSKYNNKSSNECYMLDEENNYNNDQENDDEPNEPDDNISIDELDYENESNIDDITEQIETQEDQTYITNESYYINILKENGYEVNTDKYCLLIYEKYI